MYIIKLKDESNGLFALSGTGRWVRNIIPIDEAEVFCSSAGAKNSLNQAFRGNGAREHKKEDFEVREVILTLK